ncbi:ABC transporter substrate-binding protein, partial [Rhizobium leguminosarum bv. viciae]
MFWQLGGPINSQEEHMSGLQLSQDKLIEVYRNMRMIRRFE